MADSATVVKALVEVDPGFVELVETLFGKALDPTDVWEFLYTPEGVSKMGPDPADLHVAAPIAKPAKGILVPKTTAAAVPPASAQPATVPKKAMTPAQAGVGKAEEGAEPPGLDRLGLPIVWAGEFAKADSRRHQAFGWASVVEIGGRPIVDLQGDVITPDDLEKAAYTYVEKSRVGGDQHQRDGEAPLAVGHLIESVVYTDEKYDALAKAANVDPTVFDEAPRGWWVGFQYGPGATWDDIVAGRKTGFSIHGRGKRLPVG